MMLRLKSVKSQVRRLSIVVLMLSLALSSGMLFAEKLTNPNVRVHLIVYKEQPISTQGAAETIYTNCYYGDEGNGPTGVASIEEGGTCADGTSQECTGTIQDCDRRVGFGQ